MRAFDTFQRALCRAALLASTVLLHAACGAADPSGPDVGTSAEALTYGTHTVGQYRYLSLRFVRFADDSGANAAALGYDEIWAAIDAVNAVLYRSGSDLRVRLDPATNLSALEYSTNFNNVCRPISGWATRPRDADGNGVEDGADATFLCPPLSPNRSQVVANSVISAILNSGSIPVLVRGGFYRVTYEGGWLRDNGPGIGSHGSHLIMPSSFAANTLLAHELGHVLVNNAHTFRDCVNNDCATAPEESGSPLTTNGIRIQILADVGAGNHAPSDAAGILTALFDGDAALGITDTPPDPNYKVWGNTFGDDLENKEITHLCDPANASIDVPVTFDAPFNTTYTYHFAPNRQNVLSYFKDCWNYRYFSFTRGQRNAMEDTLGDQLSSIDKPTVNVHRWRNTSNVNIPARPLFGPPAWASSKVTVSGGAPYVSAALVHFDIRTVTGGYYVDLVAPDGTVFQLQTPGVNDGATYPSAINKTMYAVDVSDLTTKDGTWELRVADGDSFLPDAYRYITDWHLEFR